MKAKVLCTALTIANWLLIVEGIDLKNPRENVVAANSSRRILFGKPANVSDFSFMVALHIGRALCGGSIIANQWVMTAAHCVYQKDCSIVRIHPAVWKFGEGFKADKCYVHPRYSATEYPYDIGLLKIDGDFIRDGRAKVVPLPPPGTNFPPGTKTILVGWGRTEESIFPDRLLRADPKVEDWNVCNEKFKKHNAKYQLDQNYTTQDIPIRIVCTQGEESSPGGSCFGDSGGPVIIKGYVAGIVSFGLTEQNGECETGSPSMHTNVADYLPWIYSFIDPKMDTHDIKVRPEH